MKLTVLRFAIVALTCTCAVLVISNLRAPKALANEDEFAALYSSLGMPVPEQTPAAPGTQEKTVAQEGREKNIKLLGDLPASQFITVMNYTSRIRGAFQRYGYRALAVLLHRILFEWPRFRSTITRTKITDNPTSAVANKRPEIRRCSATRFLERRTTRCFRDFRLGKGILRYF